MLSSDLASAEGHFSISLREYATFHLFIFQLWLTTIAVTDTA